MIHLDYIVLKNFKFTVRDNLYYEVEVFNNVDFTVDDLKLLVKEQKEIFNVKLPVLVLCNEFSSTNLELMFAVAKNANTPFAKADAFVIKSLAQKIMANFYLKISKPERPTKFFNKKEEALDWLRQYM